MVEGRVVQIGLLGFGTIGSSVYRLIQKERDQILEGTGVDLRVKKVLEIAPSRIPTDAPTGLFTTDFAEIVDDPSIDVVVEVIGGTDAAFDFIDVALRSGKNVVTANKQLLASRGEALFTLAKDERRHLRFEAAVAGAIPIIKVMRESMIAAGLHTVYGIVNGTTNYILTRMHQEEGDYAEILLEAQELGYAEADPTADVGGADAAAKMAILASIAFHSRVTLSNVVYAGIESITLDVVRHAKELGFVVKLVGAARLIEGKVSVRVFPALLPTNHPLASISGSNNAVFLEGTDIGEIMLMGPGAGGVPTATAVVSDIVSVANTKDVGFLQSCSCYRRLGFYAAEEVESAFFIKVSVADEAGVLAQIASIFGAQGVSIANMIQEGRGDEAELVLTTHPTKERQFFAAIEQTKGLACCRTEPMTLRVL
ncbi:MAG: homoserine dehydrogenase [Actinobacteria bacterium]|jgi:homoserine dehydrogenase|nr:homoserine dehydrogenase [Actinomycetota bacterium]